MGQHAVGLDPRVSVNLGIDAGAAAGLLLALARMGGFVVASPLFARTMPVHGRLALTLALALFLATPVTVPATAGTLMALALVNVVVGVVLGFITGVVFQLFTTAGAMIDVTSGMSVSMLFDPSTGTQAAVFGRLFNHVAIALFVVGGGLPLLAGGLSLSLRAIPLDGQLDASPGLADLVVDLVSTLVIAAIELALPVLAALFVAELVLGLASRFAPQANVFLLGLPAKLLITVLLVGLCLLLFPASLDGVLDSIRDGFTTTLRGLA